MCSRWRTARAALVLLLLAVNCVHGCPVPVIHRRNVERPLGQRELERWSGILGSVGVDVPPGELGERAIAFSEEVQRVRGQLVRPVHPLFDAVGVDQRWSLFPVADPEPWWMHVEARRKGETEFTLLYRPWDDEHDWSVETIEYRRVRGVWNPGSAGLRFDHPRFVDWVARRAFDEDPDWEEVRVRFAQYRLYVPGDPEAYRERTLTWHFEERRSREDVGR